MGHQFVVQLDNRPGELAHLARALATRGINITHISCAGTGTIACAYVTTTDDTETRDVLRGLGHDFVEGATLTVDVLDRPGGAGGEGGRAGGRRGGVVCAPHVR